MIVCDKYQSSPAVSSVERQGEKKIKKIKKNKFFVLSNLIKMNFSYLPLLAKDWLLERYTSTTWPTTTTTSTSILSVGLISYVSLVALLRYRRRNQIQQKFNYGSKRMTDEEAWEILWDLSNLEFPFTYLQALQFALFKVSNYYPFFYLLLVLFFFYLP